MKTTLLLLLALFPQDPVSDGAAEPVSETAGDQSLSAAGLKQRIHTMRLNLLTGGPKVQEAETEAIDFYDDKVGMIEGRMDTIRAELSEKRATYDLALERALHDESAASRQDAMEDAAGLRSEISALEAEAATLDSRRTGLNKMIQAVEARDRERERLVTQLETSESFEMGFGFPLASIGLAPAVEAPSSASPLEDQALVEDLLARDPRGARRILFEADPAGYWQRFPLNPPAPVLPQAMEFPLPDLPGQR